MEEQELIRRSRDGDREAFAVLVRTYQVKVHRLAYGFTRNDAQADDLAQGIFLKAWLGLPKFHFPPGFGPWLYRIAVNHLKDHLRKRASSREVPLEEAGVDAASRAVPADNAESLERERRGGRGRGGPGGAGKGRPPGTAAGPTPGSFAGMTAACRPPRRRASISISDPARSAGRSRTTTGSSSMSWPIRRCPRPGLLSRRS